MIHDKGRWLIICRGRVKFEKKNHLRKNIWLRKRNSVCKNLHYTLPAQIIIGTALMIVDYGSLKVVLDGYRCDGHTQLQC